MEYIKSVLFLIYVVAAWRSIKREWDWHFYEYERLFSIPYLEIFGRKPVGIYYYPYRFATSSRIFA